MDDERDEPRRSQRQLTIRRRRERPLLGVLGWAGDGRERLARGASGPRLCHQPEDDSVGASRLAERLRHQ
jgi:hypothetical protein